MIIMVFLDARWHFFGEMCAEPLFVYFSKYIQICIRLRDNNPDNASIILKKEEYEYSTFPNKVRHHSTAS